jgi:hypothetical protein
MTEEKLKEIELINSQSDALCISKDVLVPQLIAEVRRLREGHNCPECGDLIYCGECAERRLCEASAKFLDKPGPVTL